MSRIAACKVKNLKEKLKENNISFKSKDKKRVLLGKLIDNDVDKRLYQYCKFDHKQLKSQARKHGVYGNKKNRGRDSLIKVLVEHDQSPRSYISPIRKKRGRKPKQKLVFYGPRNKSSAEVISKILTEQAPKRKKRRRKRKRKIGT